MGHPLKYLSFHKNRPQERTEIVTDEGLFNDDSVRSIVGLPIVLSHPKERRYSLNREGLKVGHLLGTIGREDGKLIAEAIIDDYRGVEIIDRILREGGTPEASSGYLLSELRSRSDGIFEQIRGVYDHVAAPLLPGQGRGGENLTLRFDSGDAVAETLYFLFDRSDSESLLRTPLEKPQVSTDPKRTHHDTKGVRNVGDLIVRIEAKDQRILKDVPEDVASAIAALQSRIDSLESDLAGTQGQIGELQNDSSRLEGELTAAKTKLDEAAAQPHLDSDLMATEIQQRLDTWGLVLPTLQRTDAKFQPDYRLDSTAIKTLYLKQKAPSINLDGKGIAFIDGLWEGLKPTEQDRRQDALDKTEQQYQSLTEGVRHDRGGDKGRADLEAKRQEMMKNKHTMTS